MTGIEPVTPTMSTMLKPADTLVAQDTRFDKSGACSHSDHVYIGQSLGGIQPRVREAAMWLYLNPMTLHAVVTVRRRFALTIMEAAEAAKIARSLDRPGA